jgi:hypothetical protein
MPIVVLSDTPNMTQEQYDAGASPIWGPPANWDVHDLLT